LVLLIKIELPQYKETRLNKKVSRLFRPDSLAYHTGVEGRLPGTKLKETPDSLLLNKPLDYLLP